MAETTSEQRYTLIRDRRTVVLEDATHAECAAYIHRNHPYSLDHACRYEGYQLVRKMTPAEMQADYEAREAAEHQRFMDELAKRPLAERIDARAAWREAMERYRDTIAERIGWLFQGSYGKGALDEAHRIAAQKRGNREAAMGQLIAAVEWMCPASEARKAWHQLGPVDQENVTATIRAAIAYHSREATA